MATLNALAFRSGCDNEQSRTIWLRSSHHSAFYALASKHRRPSSLQECGFGSLLAGNFSSHSRLRNLALAHWDLITAIGSKRGDVPVLKFVMHFGHIANAELENLGGEML